MSFHDMPLIRASDTVEHIQALIRGNTPPVRVIETPVYRYA